MSDFNLEAAKAEHRIICKGEACHPTDPCLLGMTIAELERRIIETHTYRNALINLFNGIISDEHEYIGQILNGDRDE